MFKKVRWQFLNFFFFFWNSSGTSRAIIQVKLWFIVINSFNFKVEIIWAVKKTTTMWSKLWITNLISLQKWNNLHSVENIDICIHDKDPRLKNDVSIKHAGFSFLSTCELNAVLLFQRKKKTDDMLFLWKFWHCFVSKMIIKIASNKDCMKFQLIENGMCSLCNERLPLISY
jgi:hypothetical protein